MSGTNDCKFLKFSFKDNDYNFVVTTNIEDDSPFDLLLKQRWEEAQKNGIFKYTLNIRKQKILEGNYGFLAQLNPDRGEKRRKPEDITTMVQPFDSNIFNFTKISDNEILFDIGNGDGNDVIAVNVSPIEVYHSLLITERFECLPQRVTKYSLKKAIELLLLSKSPYLRVVFNSLCAHASVNHLHWHLYYFKYQMPLECIKIDRLRGPVFVLSQVPAKGFCLKLSSFPNHNIDHLVSWVYFIVDYLQTSAIAHNIYITRATENIEINTYNDIRIYIWARKSSSGIKSTCNFIPAVCELFGHISIKSEDEYEELTEDAVANVLNDITLHAFNYVRNNILEMKLEKEELPANFL
ncbi:GDP-D-glucose phosphorylase 1 [Athalia rosae]|uniref:GDP-D-glucose phosphorylase 1 n=1 Tax=Athalia rosae TaxID=37344 RepID=UPI0020333D9A|nr:GDP-D-glucose phosphorylase 1 [Athalia rosae]